MKFVGWPSAVPGPAIRPYSDVITSNLFYALNYEANHISFRRVQCLALGCAFTSLPVVNPFGHGDKGSRHR